MILWLWLGCAAKKIVGVNLIVGPECHAVGIMHGCNMQFDPPLCKSVTLAYDKDCEKLEIKK